MSVVFFRKPSVLVISIMSLFAWISFVPSNGFKFQSTQRHICRQCIMDIKHQRYISTRLSSTRNKISSLEEILNDNVIRKIWDFSRPHTLVGSALSVFSLYSFAVPFSYLKTNLFWTSLLSALVPSLLMNIYITGLNQLTDMEIDKINKPYLPLASGRLSFISGVLIVSVSLLASLIYATGSNIALQATLVGSGILGTLYSLPPFRLKRFPLLAALCILVVRGSLVNIGFFLSAKSQILGQSLSLQSVLRASPECGVITAFFAIFGVVIALMKDVPDIAGDIKHKIPSFSVQLGPEKMFRFVIYHMMLLQ